MSVRRRVQPWVAARRPGPAPALRLADSATLAMPRGIERLNVRRRPPNPLVNFITALPGPDHAVAHDYLERVAAAVYPIMRDHGLTVDSLDESPANLEFLGMNTNAGERIQLVLKSPLTGLWNPFSYTLQVMLHELSHNKHMNHSGAFYAVKDRFDREMAVLRRKGYTGEGFWSQGKTLLSEDLTGDRPLMEDEMPRELCGGTYRSQNRRRKRKTRDPNKPQLSNAEKKQRRIEKKFGVDGKKIGADEEERRALEDGKKQKVAPKVASSKRSRELRAAAALKRFEKQKTEEVRESDSDATTDDEDDDLEKTVDVGGGKRMVPVSAEEDDAAGLEEKERETREFRNYCSQAPGRNSLKEGLGREEGIQYDPKRPITLDDYYAPTLGSSLEKGDSGRRKPGRPSSNGGQRSVDAISDTSGFEGSNNPSANSTTVVTDNQEGLVCSVCSISNPLGETRCGVCLNVLDRKSHPGAWQCHSGSCPENYWNVADCGICGVCGKKKNA